MPWDSHRFAAGCLEWSPGWVILSLFLAHKTCQLLDARSLHFLVTAGHFLLSCFQQRVSLPYILSAFSSNLSMKQRNNHILTFGKKKKRDPEWLKDQKKSKLIITSFCKRKGNWTKAKLFKPVCLILEIQLHGCNADLLFPLSIWMPDWKKKSPLYILERDTKSRLKTSKPEAMSTCHPPNPMQQMVTNGQGRFGEGWMWSALDYILQPLDSRISEYRNKSEIIL